MVAGTISYAVGGFFGTLAFIGLVMNTTVLLAIYKGRMFKTSPVYILSSQTMAMDTLLISVHLFYHAPCVFFQADLYPPLLEYFFDTLLMYCWFHNSLSHILIALNRLAVIVFKRVDLFTRNRTLALSLVQHIIAIVLAVVTQMYTPCCRLRFSWYVFSYAYDSVPGITTNYSDLMTVALDIPSSAISIVSYAAIIWTMRSSRRGTNVHLDNDKRRRHQEYAYAIQFAAMAMVYSWAWILFREFPRIIGGTSNLYIYGVVTLLVEINALANATIYLINNREIKNSIRSMMGMNTSNVHIISETAHSVHARESTR